MWLDFGRSVPPGEKVSSPDDLSSRAMRPTESFVGKRSGIDTQVFRFA
jgi:hypothetical protein